jgi:hypothetical protein
LKNSNLHIPELQLKFKGDNIISFEEIKQFYQNIGPDIKDTTLKTRINRLIKQGIVSRVGRGRYILGQEKKFIPYIDETIKNIAKKIDAEFPELKFCIGHTSWLSSFMIHQPARHYIIIEPESDSDQRTLYSETIFRFLQNNYKHVFHKPDSKTVQNYVSEYNDSIIVLPLVSEAPVQKHDNIIIPTIEKILVDIFCDENIFAAQQGNEKAVIFNEVFKQYTINTSKLLRYAARRTKRAEMENYLKLLNISF